jgi:hypothetical protein
MTAEMSNAAWKGPVDEVHCVLSSMQRVRVATWRSSSIFRKPSKVSQKELSAAPVYEVGC